MFVRTSDWNYSPEKVLASIPTKNILQYYFQGECRLRKFKFKLQNYFGGDNAPAT